MRVLVLINFVLVAAAVVLAYMAFTRVDYARETAEGAAQKVGSAEEDRQKELRTFEQKMNEQVANHVSAEVDAASAKLNTRISGVQSKMTEDVGKVIEKVGEIDEKNSDAQEKVLNGLAALNTKIAKLQEQVGKGGGGGADPELRKRIEALEAEFAKWLEIILPPEVAEAR